MGEGQAGGSYRHAVSVGIAAITLALLGCGTLSLWPRPYEQTAATLSTPQDLARAYAKVEPGATRASDLATLGFDRTAGNAQVLSYLGVIERFAGDSRGFDKLDVALQTCIEARDRCTAFLFHTGEHHGDGVLSGFGLGSANAAARDAEVTLLVLDGRVAYKAISGVAMPAVAQSGTPAVRRVSAMPASDRAVY